MQQFRAEPGWRLLLDWTSTRPRRDRLTPFDARMLEGLRRARSISPYAYARLVFLVECLARAEGNDAGAVHIRQRLGADLEPATPGWGRRHFTTDALPAALLP